MTTASRLAIDRLRRLKTEREAYVGPWLPEPIISAAAPDRHLELAEDLSMAFLTLLERLSPDERAAFLLHEVFEVGYPEIASVLERSETACRQVVHRARERVRGDRKRFDATRVGKAELLERFLQAMEARDNEALLSLFAPDATWTADGGGKTAAAPRPIAGAERIARLVIGLAREVLGGQSHDRDRHRQRRDRPAHPGRRAAHRDVVDCDRRRADPGRLRGRESGQAELTERVTPPGTARLGCRKPGTQMTGSDGAARSGDTARGAPAASGGLIITTAHESPPCGRNEA